MVEGAGGRAKMDECIYKVLLFIFINSWNQFFQESLNENTSTTTGVLCDSTQEYAGRMCEFIQSCHVMGHC